MTTSLSIGRRLAPAETNEIPAARHRDTLQKRPKRRKPLARCDVIARGGRVFRRKDEPAGARAPQAPCLQWENIKTREGVIPSLIGFYLFVPTP